GELGLCSDQVFPLGPVGLLNKGNGFGKSLLLKVREKEKRPVSRVGRLAIAVARYPRRETSELRIVVSQGDADLLQFICALGLGSGSTNSLHGRNEQAHQDRNDCDHYQQLDESEAAMLGSTRCHGILPEENPNGEARVGAYAPAC